MNISILIAFAILSLGGVAQAVLANVPGEGISFNGTIKEIKPAEGGWRDLGAPNDEFQVVVMEKPTELSKDEKDSLYKILCRLARFKVRRATDNSAEVVFKKADIKGLKVGDRVEITDYQVVVASESDVVRLGEKNGITKK